jgi:SAM-dependent methyltransferase
LKGYIDGTSFDVYVCSECAVSFVSPMEETNGIYEYIYNQSKIIPGYERYYRYSELVQKSNKPLKLLANAEAPYWAVSKIIESNYGTKKNSTSLLEIGSGLGYLTYSLDKAGYKVTGLDISQKAVEDSAVRYGDLYRQEDIFVLADKQEEKYDCIVMMEVLEHVTNPEDFLSAATSLLKVGGKLIVTTPNKTSVPAGVNSVWQSDFPPVHFWFFTEAAVRTMVQKIGRTCSFYDFTEYNNKFFSPQYDSSIEAIQVGLPRLLKDGTINPKYIADQSKTELYGVYGRYLLSYIRRRLKKKNFGQRSTTMCVVIE